MKRYLLKLSMVGFWLAIAILFECLLYLLFFQFGTPQYTAAYTGAVMDKVARLNSIEEPKIILVGNSNVAIGFDSATIEEAFGMPVVNMGVNGALCNAFHEDLATLNLNKGDIVVVAHSEYDDDATRMDANVLWVTLENHRELLPTMRASYLPKLLKGFPEYLVNNLQLAQSGTGNLGWEDSIYSRDAFNAYGDNVYPRSERIYEFSQVDKRELEVTQSTIDRLNDLNERCADEGATLVVAGFPVAEGEYTAPTETFVDAWQTLKDGLDCPVISEIEDYFIPYDCFYDSWLHLNDEGVQLRTAQLIEDLQDYLAEF